MKTFKFYSDSGHGWLAVKRQLVYDLNLADTITRYSHQNGCTAYLEEDCDANVFLRAYELTYGKEYVIKNVTSKRNNSPIRDYEQFSVFG